MADPFFSSVVLLAVNDNKPDGTTVFADQSTSAKTLTANGQAQYDTAQAPTGMTSSMLLDGTGDYLSSLDSIDWTMAAGDFTVEWMIRFNGVVSSQFSAFNQDAGSSPNRGWGWYRNGAASAISWYTPDGSSVVQKTLDNWSPAGDTWYHYAVCRNGNNLRHFVDGVQVGANADVTGASYADVTASFVIGAWPGLGGFGLNGWISNFRLTKGVARYTAAFTPPSLPLPISAVDPVIVTATSSGVRKAQRGKFSVKLSDLKSDQSTADFLKSQLRRHIPDSAFDAPQTDTEQKNARKEKRAKEKREAKMRADAQMAERQRTEALASEISAEIEALRKSNQQRKNIRTLMSLAAMVV